LQGLSRDFDTLPALPAANGPWIDCGTATGAECPSGATIGIPGTTPSRLEEACNDGDDFVGTGGSACNFLTFVDYTFFQTFVTVPACNAGTPFYIQYLDNDLDDAANVYIYNCKYNGTLVAHNGICCCGCAAINDPGNPDYCSTNDLSGYLVSGVNRIVIAHVDDYVSFRGIDLNFISCGTALSPTCPSATACQTNSYDEETGACESTPVSNGITCTLSTWRYSSSSGVCTDGACVENPSSYDDGDNNYDEDDDYYYDEDDDNYNNYDEDDDNYNNYDEDDDNDNNYDEDDDNYNNYDEDDDNYYDEDDDNYNDDDDDNNYDEDDDNYNDDDYHHQPRHHYY
jgi:hypothetical protein